MALNPFIEPYEGPIKHPKGNDKINYIIDFFTDMCDAPYTIYLRTLYPALMEALITYYELDAVQIFTRFVKPPNLYKHLRGSPHGRGNRKRGGPRTYRHFWKSWTGFDPNNAIGDAIKVDDGLDVRGVTPGVSTLWHLYDVEQRVLYWIMLYEITEQFFYRWSSSVAESYYCQAQYRPICIAYAADDGNLGIVPETPSMIEGVIKARGVAFVGGNLIQVQGRGSTCTFRATYEGGPGIPPGEPGKRIFIRHSDGTIAMGPDFLQVGDTAVVSAATSAEGSWTFWSTGDYNWTMSNLEFTVIGFENVLAPD